MNTVHRRGDSGYEAARRALVWNARLPDRFPAVIVQARDQQGVVEAVRLAKREGLRLTVRSGGHSWAGSHLREGTLVIDVSRLDSLEVDRSALRARVGPGCGGAETGLALLKQGLFFPVGHCRGVKVGGYLLQGGFGWNSRAWGPACESVVGLDLVTADGDVVYADERENADLFWAARGAGPGFFCVVTRFHLRLRPRPKVIGFGAQSFAREHLDEVFRWAHDVGPSVPSSVELQILLSRQTPGVEGPGMLVVAPIFADGFRSAWRELEFLRDSPLARRARRKVPFVPSGLAFLYDHVMEHYPSHHRYAVDNVWTHASADELLPHLRRIADTLPPAPSHALWLNWAPPTTRPDMAFSMEDRTYLALYGIWSDAADDARYADWAVSNVRPIEPLATGCQLADENLGVRPARFVGDAQLARLDRIRAERDPSTRFHEWMGRPR